MKSKKILIPLGLLIAISSGFSSVAMARNPLNPKPSNVEDAVIVPGIGFSYDSEQLAPIVCFNAKTLKPTNGSTVLSLNASKSFSELQQALRWNVSGKIGWGMFSSSAEASYLRSVEDKDYSMSLNYFEYTSGTVLVQPNLEQPLNPDGQAEYTHNYTYFGVTCGDAYINTYQSGAELVMSLNLSFNSEYEKKIFQAKAGINFGDIVSASGKIQEAASKYNLQGNISIQAYQLGGNPAELSKIITPGKNGKYNVLTCDLQNMTACVQAAGKLLTYAGNNFSSQISYTTGKGLQPLNTGFAHYTSIEALGLTPPKSLVTPEVVANRKYLASVLETYQYYTGKFHSLLQGYVVPWDTNSITYKNSVALQSKANSDIALVMSPDAPAQGGLACYDDLYKGDPNNCNATAQRIKQNLQEITASDLDYLLAIRYTYPLAGYTGVIFPNGAIPNGTDTGYGCYLDPNATCTIHSVLISPTKEDVDTELTDPSYHGYYKFYASSTDGGQSYTGWAYRSPHVSLQATGYRAANPFFFTAYGQ